MRSLISAIMNKFKLYFILFCSLFVLFSCNKSDSVSSVPIRDFDVQYSDDIAIIEDYLNTHYLMVLNDNQDVEIKKIDAGQASMMTLLSKPDGDYPLLRKVPVVIKEVTYYLYYIKLRADNPTGISPSKADQVFTAYDGHYLSYKTEKVDDVDVTTLEATQFQYVPFPSRYLGMDTSIRGWKEIMPLFKAGTSVNIPGEPESFANFGAGLIFIPSGMGYFSQPQPGIPSYSPLVFSFKLYDVKLSDLDGDGVLSNDEDLNHDGDFTNDDTDGDGVQNLYDVDDDGDSYLTKNEIKIDGVVPASYGLILDCSGTTTGLKKHLDPSCH